MARIARVVVPGVPTMSRTGQPASAVFFEASDYRSTES